MYIDNVTFSCMENILHHFTKTWIASLTEFFCDREDLKEHVNYNYNHKWAPRNLSAFQKMLENVCYVDRSSDWEHDCEVRCFRAALDAIRAFCVLRCTMDVQSLTFWSHLRNSICSGHWLMSHRSLNYVLYCCKPACMQSCTNCINAFWYSYVHAS